MQQLLNPLHELGCYHVSIPGLKHCLSTVGTPARRHLYRLHDSQPVNVQIHDRGLLRGVTAIGALALGRSRHKGSLPLPT